MDYKKKICVFCLRLKLKSLERKRIFIIESYIASNPSKASKSDDIEKLIVSEDFISLVKNINVIKRFLKLNKI